MNLKKKKPNETERDDIRNVNGTAICVQNPQLERFESQLRIIFLN